MEASHRPHDCLVTGTDTEIGKTLVAAALLVWLRQQGLSTVGMKPVAAGIEVGPQGETNEDVQALDAASTEHPALAWRTPYLLCTPASPHIAARIDGVAIDLHHVMDNYRRLCGMADAVVVEGVGGFRVPLAERVDTAHMAVQFGLPVILVVGLRLGCINQALLTAEAIASRGLRLAGWVANSTQFDMPHEADNIDTLRRLMDAPCLGHVPRLSQPRAEEAAARLDGRLLSAILGVNPPA
jgi:dethiobiotin synthetase